MQRESVLAYDNVPVDIAAKYLGVGPMFIRCGLRERILPFGTALKRENRYTYQISPGRLVDYKEGANGRD